MSLLHFIGSGFLSNTVGAPLASQFSLYEDRMTEFSLTKEVTERSVKGIVDGSYLVQELDNIVTETTYTLKTTTASIDSQLLALMTGESWATTSSYTGKLFKRVSVPTASPYEITDTDITSGLTATDVQVSVVIGGSTIGRPRPLLVATTGSPSATSCVMTAASNKIAFDSSLAGATIKYSVPKAYTSKSTLGVETSYGLLNDMAFYGIMQTTTGRAGAGTNQILLACKKLSPSGGWTLSLGGESNIELSYKCTVSGSDRSPVQMVEL